jgi:predicted dinucleotide-binding enzyme
VPISCGPCTTSPEAGSGSASRCSSGNIGSRLAANFAAGGLDFLLAGRDQEAARKIASDLDGRAEVVSVDEAVERADVLVPALWLGAFEQLIARYGERRPGGPARRLPGAAAS